MCTDTIAKRFHGKKTPFHGNRTISTSSFRLWTPSSDRCYWISVLPFGVTFCDNTPWLGQHPTVLALILSAEAAIVVYGTRCTVFERALSSFRAGGSFSRLSVPVPPSEIRIRDRFLRGRALSW